jgi:hypothetical protein
MRGDVYGLRRRSQVTRAACMRYHAAGGDALRRMNRMNSIPIDLAAVNWLYVVVLALFAFIATLIGNLLSFNHRGFGAVLSAVLFAVIFVFWTYYPHGLPLPTSVTAPPAAVTAAPPVPPKPAVPARPANPVTDVTPPAGNSR